MNNKDKAVINILSELYSYIYANKELYNSKFTKYTPEEVNKAIGKIESEKTLVKEKNNSIIRNEILNIKTKEEVERFYINNLTYDHSNQDSKKKCLKNFTVDELKYLYNIILSTPLKKKVTKSEVLYSIENYFESINRVMSMKP
ncbi:hypothetical protein [Clostridium sp. SGI.024]|uniref:hypothetical protein n=1 Tax=Clostridium sp. SGI.024 TaxID=3420551 RepID=UPI003D0151B5